MIKTLFYIYLDKRSKQTSIFCMTKLTILTNQLKQCVTCKFLILEKGSANFNNYSSCEHVKTFAYIRQETSSVPSPTWDSRHSGAVASRKVLHDGSSHVRVQWIYGTTDNPTYCCTNFELWKQGNHK